MHSHGEEEYRVLYRDGTVLATELNREHRKT